MRHYFKLILAITLIISTSNLVQAKRTDPSKHGPAQRPNFESIDINENGEIDFTEFSSHKRPHGDAQTIFDTIDTDSDGLISNEEFVNHKPPMRKKRGEERS